MFKHVLASLSLSLPVLTEMLMEQALGPMIDPNGKS